MVQQLIQRRKKNVHENNTDRGVMQSYAATRIHAMHAALMTQQTYERLLKMSPQEIIHYLQSTEYREDIDVLALKDLADLSTIDRVIAHNSDRILRKLQRICTSTFPDTLLLLLHDNDMWNLTVIAEAIAGSTSVQEALLLYGRQGSFDPRPLAGAKTIAELSQLARVYMPRAIATPTTLTTFMTLVEQLPVQSYNAKKNHFVNTQSSRASLHATYALLVDEHNIVELLMRKRENMAPAQIQQRLRRGGTIFWSVLSSAVQATTLTATLDILRTTRYAKALAVPGDDLVTLEFSVRREVMRRMRKHAGRFPLGPSVLLRYVMEKEMELDNLRLLIKGKYLGLDESFIRTQLAIG